MTPEGGGRGKTFVLGMGCQKGGTSWLYDYLAASPQYMTGYKKEFHVFDTVEATNERRLQNLGLAARELRKAQSGKPYKPGRLHWAAMAGDPEMYFDYFTGLLHRHPGIRTTGDLTPAHSFIPAERVAQIRQGFEHRRIRTVGLFLMRDPVERVWSQVRMLERNEPGYFGVPPEEAVAHCYADPLYDVRTRYDHTLQVLDASFAPDERFIGFYEELFAEEPVRQICDLVGIDYRAPDLHARSNESPKGGSSLPDDVVRDMAEHYRGVYEAVAQRFPDKNLHRLWPSSRLVL